MDVPRSDVDRFTALRNAMHSTNVIHAGLLAGYTATVSYMVTVPSLAIFLIIHSFHTVLR